MRSMGFYLEAALGKLRTILLSLASALPDAPLPQPPLTEAPAVRSPDADPLVGNTPWVKLAGERIELFAELDRYSQDFDPPRREVSEHVCCRLTEILARNGVSLISENAPFDRNLHEPISRLPDWNRGLSRRGLSAQVLESAAPSCGGRGLRLLRKSK